MNPEMTELIDRFRNGTVPMLQFMKMMKELKERNNEPLFKEELGKAVVAGRARHTEGRDLMSILLEAYGFETVVMPRDSSIGDVVKACIDNDASVLCISVQMTYDIPELHLAQELMTEFGIRDDIVFNVGGVAVSRAVAEQIGCDVYEGTAVDSVESIKAEVLRRKSL